MGDSHAHEAVGAEVAEEWRAPVVAVILPAATTALTRDQLRSRRPREVRSKTISISRTPKRDMKLLRKLYPEADEVHEQRPRTRGECADGPRPCPWVSCKHHLFLDVTRHGGLKLNFPDLEPDQLEQTCSLDVADEDEDGATLERVGALMNVTRERIRQLEVRGLHKVGTDRSITDAAATTVALRRSLRVLQPYEE